MGFRLRSPRMLAFVLVPWVVSAATVLASPPYTGASEYWLLEDEIHAARAEALAGDGSAAYRLAEHFLLGANDLESGDFWLRLGAELGDCQAQARLAAQYRGRLSSASEDARARLRRHAARWEREFAQNPRCPR